MPSPGTTKRFWTLGRETPRPPPPPTSNDLQGGSSQHDRICNRPTVTSSSDSHLFERSSSATSQSRALRFRALLDSPNVDLGNHPLPPLHGMHTHTRTTSEKLKVLAWSGVPVEMRPQTWKILLGYLPTNKERRQATLERKRQEYLDFVPEYERVKEQQAEGTADDNEAAIFHQIHIDVPRTNPSSNLFQNEVVQQSLETILFLWALRHPASGYVQGINDLVTPFFVVFLSEYMTAEQIEACQMESISSEDLRKVEADCFWCMTKLLDSIQENYTFAQPGIQRMVFRLEELTHKIDSDLAYHLQEQEAQFIQFAFRWMNCLLMREIPLRLIVRIWDTYLSEAEEFAIFHVYVCAAFLTHWSTRLRQLEFHELMVFLQNLPTPKWNHEDVDMLLSQAFLFKSLYHDAPSHLRE